MNRAIILLAGKGTRFDANTPKQFIEINGKPLFVYCVQTFENCPLIDSITLVTAKEYVGLVKDLIGKYNLKKINNVVVGGETRQESSFNGLKASKAKDDDAVLIHDAARVLVSEDIIINNIHACQIGNAVVTAINSVDSIAEGENEIVRYLDRNLIHEIQTPQTFIYKDILEAHLKYAGQAFTDDASLLIKNSKHVHFVNGSRNNIKVTTRDDLEFIKRFLNE